MSLLLRQKNNKIEELIKKRVKLENRFFNSSEKQIDKYKDNLSNADSGFAKIGALSLNTKKDQNYLRCYNGKGLVSLIPKIVNEKFSGEPPYYIVEVKVNLVDTKGSFSGASEGNITTKPLARSLSMQQSK